MFFPVLLLLAGGMFSVLAMCPIGKMPWQFIRMVGALELVITIAVLAGWAVSDSRDDGALLFPWMAAMALGMIALATVGLAPLLGSRPAAGSSWLRSLAAGGGVMGLAGAWSQAEALTRGSRILTALGQLLSAMLLGSVTIAWLLGHRYLTSPEMTIDPLKRAAQVLIGALSMRWVFLLALLGAAFAATPSTEAAVMWSSVLSAEWLMVAIRIGVGLVLPSMFLYMAWDCVKLRSTQSATGILFFMFIFVVIGELTSGYLRGRLGWWL